MARQRVRNAVLSLLVTAFVFGPIAIYHFEVNRLTSTLAAFGVEVTSVALVRPAESTDLSVYRLTLRLTNPGLLLVKYTTTGATASLGTYTAGLRCGDRGLLGPGESVDLTKDLTLPAAALEQIGDSGQVAITGQIDFELAASWRWLAVEAR
ncbi:MAG: hypothetical protein Q8P31_11035, partial [Bacillota bacterium]|nr:hypothetical protein [Bacillota bacterium]